ncbi:MAG: type III-A CRISPR-associated RAMP protein Csm5 [bacterium]
MKTIKTYKVELTTITPIHIGTGEDYVPVDYVIKKAEDKNNYFYFIQREKFINHIIKSDKYNEFLSICNDANFMKINKYIFDNFSEDMIDWKMPVSSKVFETYEENISMTAKKNEINRLEIRSFIQDNFNKKIYIPGSSVKGSIRTAVLNYKIKNGKFSASLTYNPKSIDIEKNILNIKEKNNSDDPFRLVKISDFKEYSQESTGKRNSFVDKVINIKSGKDLNEGKGIPVLMELSLRERKFIGEITIIDDDSNRDKIDINLIINAMNCHYGESCFDFELSTFPNVFKDEVLKKLDDVKKVTKINNNSFLMKIGNHSGAFEVTMEGYRKIKIKTENGDRESDRQTTIWVNEFNKLPLGWVKCDIIENF